MGGEIQERVDVTKDPLGEKKNPTFLYSDVF